jgi:hypothetical protein
MHTRVFRKRLTSCVTCDDDVSGYEFSKLMSKEKSMVCGNGLWLQRRANSARCVAFPSHVHITYHTCFEHVLFCFFLSENNVWPPSFMNAY